MRAIDTNVLIRLIARDDAEQVEKAEMFVERGAWVSQLVLAETVWVLESVFDLDAKQIATVIGMLLEHDHIVVQDDDVVHAALGEFKRRRAVGFTDCLVVEVARKAGNVPIGTFDKAMSRISGADKL